MSQICSPLHYVTAKFREQISEGALAKRHTNRARFNSPVQQPIHACGKWFWGQHTALANTSLRSEVTNDRGLRSTYCTTEDNYWQDMKHRAASLRQQSCLSATWHHVAVSHLANSHVWWITLLTNFCHWAKPPVAIIWASLQLTWPIRHLFSTDSEANQTDAFDCLATQQPQLFVDGVLHYELETRHEPANTHAGHSSAPLDSTSTV